MGLQTTVTHTPAPAIAGHVESALSTNDRIAEADIQGGLFVTHGSTEGGCALPTTADEVAAGLGVAPARVMNDSGFPTTNTAGVTHQEGDVVGAVSKGKVWVVVEEEVDPGDPAYVRYDTGAGGSQKGAFRKTADTSTAAAIAGRYRTHAVAEGLALLEVNLP